LIRALRENSLIIRPSGFVGYGLLKNPIYDLLYSNKLFVHPESQFQFCDVDWFADTVVWMSLQELTGIWNVSATETVSIKEVSEMANLTIGEVLPDALMEQHELSTEKLGKLIEIPATGDVVKLFLEKFAK
jgi:plasmid maintenance system antidote protein VapI